MGGRKERHIFLSWIIITCVIFARVVSTIFTFFSLYVESTIQCFLSIVIIENCYPTPLEKAYICVPLQGRDIDSTRYIFYLRIFKKRIDIFFFFFILLHFQKIVSTSFYITVIYFHFKCTKCPVTCGWQYSRIIAFQPWYHLHIPLYCRSIILFTGIKAYRRVINELSFTVHRFLRLPPRNSSPKILQRYSKKIHAKKTFEISSFLSSFQFSIQNVQSSEVEIEDHFKFVSRRECCRLNYFLSQV